MPLDPQQEQTVSSEHHRKLEKLYAAGDHRDAARGDGRSSGRDRAIAQDGDIGGTDCRQEVSPFDIRAEQVRGKGAG